MRGLTQKEESQEGYDFSVQLCPCTRIVALQFKRPSENKAIATKDYFPYTFRIQKEQHSILYQLAKIEKNSVFYVFPFYPSLDKFQKDVPELCRDTWLLPVDNMNPNVVFKKPNKNLQFYKSKTVYCRPRWARINPDFVLYNARDLELGSSVGIPVQEFSIWYRNLRDSHTLSEEISEAQMELRRRNSWIVRGLRIAVIYGKCDPVCYRVDK